jgi:hypothetical protein
LAAAESSCTEEDRVTEEELFLAVLNECLAQNWQRAPHCKYAAFLEADLLDDVVLRTMLVWVDINLSCLCRVEKPQEQPDESSARL